MKKLLFTMIVLISACSRSKFGRTDSPEIIVSEDALTKSGCKFDEISDENNKKVIDLSCHESSPASAESSEQVAAMENYVRDAEKALQAKNLRPGTLLLTKMKQATVMQKLEAIKEANADNEAALAAIDEKQTEEAADVMGSVNDQLSKPPVKQNNK
jgi:hypothetical protein